MKKILKENFYSIVDRGLINRNTTINDFMNKLREEVDELDSCILTDFENRNEELADVILVCLNMAYFLGIDIEIELKNKIHKNKTRQK